MRERISKRQFLKYSAATALGALAAPAILGRAHAQDFTGKTLRVLTWSDATGQAAVKNIATPLEQATGARVVADLVGATSEMVAKVKASASDPQFDIVLLSSVGAIQLADEGLLEKPDLQRVPNAADVPSELLTGADGYGAGYYLYTDGLVFGTNAFAEPPTSYREMWDEKYSQRLFLPPAGWTEAMELTALAAKMAGGSIENPDPGFELLAQLKDRVLLIAEQPPQVGELFRSGALDLGALYPPQSLIGFLGNPDYPMSLTLGAEEGFTYDLQLMVIPKGHPGDTDLIHAFINQAMSPEAQTGMVRDAWYAPINRNVAIPDDLKSLPFIIDANEVLENGLNFDKRYLASVRGDWAQRYTEIFGG